MAWPTMRARTCASRPGCSTCGSASRFQVGEQQARVRVGNQVVSWGESLFLPGGINSTNAMDIMRLSQPGTQLKEVFLPAPIVSVASGLGIGPERRGLCADALERQLPAADRQLLVGRQRPGQGARRLWPGRGQGEERRPVGRGAALAARGHAAEPRRLCDELPRQGAQLQHQRQRPRRHRLALRGEPPAVRPERELAGGRLGDRHRTVVPTQGRGGAQCGHQRMLLAGGNCWVDEKKLPVAPDRAC